MSSDAGGRSRGKRPGVSSSTSTSTSTSTSSDEATTTPARRRSPLRALFGRGSLDIQSTLLVMLLAVSFLAAIVIGSVGYVNGRDSLRAAAFDQVTSIRESRARDVERTLATASPRSTSSPSTPRASRR
jgi:hypothetical protein